MKNQSYNDFWQRIHSIAKQNEFPLRVMFELTYNCNFKCIHCYVPMSYRKEYRKKELNTEKVFKVLDQLRDIGCFYLGFTGGEPFLRPDIINILEYAKRCGFQIIINTNGSLIDEKIINKLAQLKVNKVDVTIPAISEKAFRRITQVSGAKEKVLKAIRLLRKKGVDTAVKTCLLKYNEPEAGKIKRFARFLNIYHRLDDGPSPRLDGSKEPYRYRADNILKSKIQNPKSKNCIIKTPRQKLTTENIFYCGVGQTQAAITPAGELKMCLMIDYPKYNILITSLKECWCRLKKICTSIKPDKHYECHKCDLKIYCKWCPASGWLEDKSFTTCDPESKYLARMERAL